MASPIGRVTLAGAAIVVLMVGAIVVSIWRSEVASTAANIAIANERQVAIAESAHDALFDRETAALASGGSESSRRTAVVSARVRLARLITELNSPAIIDRDDRQLLRAISADEHVLTLLEGPILDGRHHEADAGRGAEFRRAVSAIDGDLDRFDAANRRQATAAAEKAHTAHGQARTIALVIGGLAVLLVLVLVAYVIRVVATYLSRMRADAEALESQMEALTAARLETLKRLAATAEYRDDDTHAHTERVGALAGDLAEWIGLPPDEVELIRLAAPLHDIGKVGISDLVLLKQGPLTDRERADMQRHTTMGAAILDGSESPVLRLGREIALAHHERWDGDGYPNGLSGYEIPLPARIVAVADVFDALTHDRPYKRAWPMHKALQEIVAQAGRQFDPLIAEALPVVRCPHISTPSASAPAAIDNGALAAIRA